MVVHQNPILEEQLVAELEKLGVGYLSRQSETVSIRVRAPQVMMAELVWQPSSRVRAALIPLLLAHPEYAGQVPAALRRLDDRHGQTLKFFYTAAVFLQEQYGRVFQEILGTKWKMLPDLFSTELRVSGKTPKARLNALARAHAGWSGVQLNWAGTYENAVQHLLRRWEMERNSCGHC